MGRYYTENVINGDIHETIESRLTARWKHVPNSKKANETSVAYRILPSMRVRWTSRRRKTSKAVSAWHLIWNVTDRAGIEPRVARSKFQRPNHWAIKVPERPSCLRLAGSLQKYGLHFKFKFKFKIVIVTDEEKDMHNANNQGDRYWHNALLIQPAVCFCNGSHHISYIRQMK